MKKGRKNLFIGMGTILIVALLYGGAFSSDDRIMVIGTVNADFQIQADNDRLFEIGDNEKGGELAQLVDKRVRVMGTVEEVDGQKVLMVISYEIIGE